MILLPFFLLALGLVGFGFGCRLWGDRDYFLSPLMRTLFLVAGVLLIGVGISCFSDAYVNKTFFGSGEPSLVAPRR